MRIANQAELLNTEESTTRTGGEAITVGLRSVTMTYGKTHALRGVDLDLTDGTTVLLGRNGAGKSTLSRIITGVEKPTSGQLERRGCAVEDATSLRHHHQDTGWLPQALSLPASLTVEQYLRYAAWLKSVKRESALDAVNAALDLADLTELRGKRLGELSGGMVRRVGIAQAVVHEPTLLVLDEPTVGLDPEQRTHFHAIIQHIAETRVVLLSTHLLEDVEALASRVVVLDQGALKFDGTTEGLRRMSGVGPMSAASLRSGFLAVLST